MNKGFGIVSNKTAILEIARDKKLWKLFSKSEYPKLSNKSFKLFFRSDKVSRISEGALEPCTSKMSQGNSRRKK